MRQFVIAANWKMNKDIPNGIELLEGIKKSILGKELHKKVRIVLCPPFILLDRAHALLNASPLALGAQNMHFENDGAFTGEISGSMLRSAGCEYVILGHSERRAYFGETDVIVNKKVHKALAAGLHPIVCVGETLEQRESGITEKIVEAQVIGVLKKVDADQLRNVVLAYEPVWAIGTGRNATPQQAQDVHTFIRRLVIKLYGQTEGDNIIIQYGGSMKADNAKELLAQPDVDGGLIGGASLVVEQFTGIVQAAYDLSV